MRPCTALPGGRSVFAGQRAEGFYVDLGAIFDLGDPAALRAGRTHIRSGQHRLGAMAAGINATEGLNVHSIAIQVPIRPTSPTTAADPSPASSTASVIGVWTTASRQKARVLDAADGDVSPIAVPGCRCRGSATRS